MNANSQPQDNLPLSVNDLPDCSHGQSESSSNSFQPMTTRNANSSECEACNELRASLSSDNIFRHAYMSVLSWFYMLIFMHLLFKFYPDVTSNLERYLFFGIECLVICWSIYLYFRRRPQELKLTLEALLKIILILKMTIIVPGSIFIMVILKSLINSTPFPETPEDHHWLLVGRRIIHFLTFGLGLAAIYGIYKNLTTIHEVRKMLKQSRILFEKNE